jgi:hypothetical protein
MVGHTKDINLDKPNNVILGREKNKSQKSK